MKFIFVIILLFFSINYAFTQSIKGFGGLGIYRNTIVDKSVFMSLNGGLEFKIIDYVKPDIEFNYFIASFQNKTKEDLLGFEKERLERYVTAVNISLCPKFILGHSDDKIKFQIAPKFNISKSFARGALYTLDNSKIQYVLSSSDSASEIKTSLGIYIGLTLDLNDNATQTLAFNLYYNNVDLGNVVNLLKFGNSNLHTDQSLGVGVVYYFAFNTIKKTKK